jgi:hypothetical protein
LIHLSMTKGKDLVSTWIHILGLPYYLVVGF